MTQEEIQNQLIIICDELSRQLKEKPEKSLQELSDQLSAVPTIRNMLKHAESRTMRECAQFLLDVAERISKNPLP